MIYHEKTQIRAKAGFHVSVEMYDGTKCMMCVEWICWHKFGYWLWYISRTLAVKLLWFEKRKMMLPVDPVLHITVAHQGTGTGCSTNSTGNKVSGGISSLFLAISPSPVTPKGVFCFSPVWFVSQQGTCSRIAYVCFALHPEWRKHRVWDIHSPVVWYFGSLSPFCNIPVRSQCL